MHVHRKLFGFARNVHGFLPGLSVLSLLISATVIIQMVLISKCITTIFLESEIPELSTFAYLLAAIILRAILVIWRERFAQLKALEIKSSIRKLLMHNLLHRDNFLARKENTGELVAVVADGVEKLDDYYAKYFPAIIHIAVFPTSLLIFTFFYDPLSAGVLLVTAPVILFFMWLIGTQAKILTRRQWESLEGLSGYFLDVLQGLKTLKIFNAEKGETDNVASASNSFRILTMKVLKVAFLSGFVLELAASLSIAMVALQVSIRLIEGLMVLEAGLLMLLLAPEFYLPFRMLGSYHHAGMEGAAAAGRMLDIGLHPPMHEPKIMSRTFNGKTPVTVEFRDVSFTYPSDSQVALHRVSCTLEPGSITALVGRTGSGKSTFAKLILKYLKLTHGTILVNGISINDIENEQWWSNLSYVAQNPHFFNGTILENLLAANTNANIKEVHEAANISGIHDTILRLPRGYNEVISDNASRLSAGERQRLAIARAFLKDAPMIILDEPTSNLDPHSERLVTEATRQLIKGRTTLVIAHRLGTVVHAHKVLVLDKGLIAETGTHHSLIQQQGVYSGFFDDNQLQGIR